MKHLNNLFIFVI